MPPFWGPSNEELTSAQTHNFSANLDTPPVVNELGGDNRDSDESEGEDDESMDDRFGHLFDLAEVAHLVDFYHTDENISPLLEDITLHENSTPNSSPQKCNHL
jgi:hypothetical protein